MNDWYAAQDANRMAFPQSFSTYISQACGLPKAPADVFALARKAAQAQPGAYKACTGTPKNLAAALKAFQQQVPATEIRLPG